MASSLAKGLTIHSASLKDPPWCRVDRKPSASEDENMDTEFLWFSGKRSFWIKYLYMYMLIFYQIGEGHKHNWK